MGESIVLDRGVFTLSLDFELIWGTLDLFGPEKFRRRCEIERQVVVDRLLDLFVEFDISATWCIVGHLFLGRCDKLRGQRHPEIVRPRHGWHSGDWFQHDTEEVETDTSIFLGRRLVQKIMTCPVRQEIGAHSFSHVIFGDPGCSPETARTELEACVTAGRALGVSLHSFTFPRNRIGHLDLLAHHGFTGFRGRDRCWYERDGMPSAVQRLAHLWDVLTITEPPVVTPSRVRDGLVEIPGSMVFFPAHGFRRLIPVAWRVRRALKGLDAAVRERRLFHLWTHPTNLVDGVEAMLGGFRQILERAALLRNRGRLTILPMGDVVPLAFEPERAARQ